MTIQDLASKVALTEGKKLQTEIGNVREVLAILSDLIYEDKEVYEILYKNGERRAKHIDDTE